MPAFDLTVFVISQRLENFDSNVWSKFSSNDPRKFIQLVMLGKLAAAAATVTVVKLRTFHWGLINFTVEFFDIIESSFQRSFHVCTIRGSDVLIKTNKKLGSKLRHAENVLFCFYLAYNTAQLCNSFSDMYYVGIFLLILFQRNCPSIIHSNLCV